MSPQNRPQKVFNSDGSLENINLVASINKRWFSSQQNLHKGQELLTKKQTRKQL